VNKTEIREFLDKVTIDPKLAVQIEKNFLMVEDGYYAYFPPGADGFYSEGVMLMIVAMLNKKNRPWDDDVDEFFRG
jgi:hypothetical protein